MKVRKEKLCNIYTLPSGVQINFWRMSFLSSKNHMTVSIPQRGNDMGIEHYPKVSDPYWWRILQKYGIKDPYDRQGKEDC